MNFNNIYSYVIKNPIANLSECEYDSKVSKNLNYKETTTIGIKSNHNIQFVSDNNFEDGSLLDYSEHELTEEQLQKISNYFLK